MLLLLQAGERGSQVAGSSVGVRTDGVAVVLTARRWDVREKSPVDQRGAQLSASGAECTYHRELCARPS